MSAEHPSAKQPHDEFSLIGWIGQQASDHSEVMLGIGDDTAVLRVSPDHARLATVDTLMEGVHFTMPPATAQQVGHKALAVNLSDIAAMAGRPQAALVSLVLPKQDGAAIAQGIHTGIQTLADTHNVAIAGGDTNTWNGPLVVSITVLGETGCRQTGQHAAVPRSGAQAGDWIMVTGTLGGSLAGKHLDFQPRLTEARTLNQSVSLHAMIDVSDGLSADLHHILHQSRVGAIVEATSIPISAAADHADDGRSPLEHALCDGEDFELLFCVNPQDGQNLLSDPPFETRLTKIGEITHTESCQLKTSLGHLEKLPAQGWRHPFDAPSHDA